MQIEKLNENQIRLTLSKKDLEQKQLRLSELAYGSSRARELLHEMIQQASTELGFEVDNIPLMVEAIPISGDCLVLVITKIDDPEKLDDKLSLLTKLAEMIKDENYDPNLFDIEDNDDLLDDYQAAIDDDDDDFVSVGISDEDESVIDSSLDPLGLTAPFAQALAEAKKTLQKKDPDQDKDKPQKDPMNRIRLYTFQDLDQIIRLSAFLTPFYEGESTLYKETDTSPYVYYLFLSQKETSSAHFKRACMIASDFGMKTPASYASAAYCKEHCKLIIEGNALEVLNKFNV